MLNSWIDINWCSMIRLLHYKGIEEERFQDAPFIGALVLSTDCHKNCPGCFNQYLRAQKSFRDTAEGIILNVMYNPLHQGIILGGLEWTEQPEDMLCLIDKALKYDLKVMLYTHHTLEWLLEEFPILNHSGIYVKTGEYQRGEESHQDNGVWLASSNQVITHLACASTPTWSVK